MQEITIKGNQLQIVDQRNSIIYQISSVELFKAIESHMKQVPGLIHVVNMKGSDDKDITLKEGDNK